ncbi:MAG: hypothetical protein PHY45_03645 [Rhodocyclaceae bacterium]|nr:hypothetical protein [Rhodocyclaceae bacterium]
MTTKRHMEALPARAAGFVCPRLQDWLPSGNNRRRRRRGGAEIDNEIAAVAVSILAGNPKNVVAWELRISLFAAMQRRHIDSFSTLGRWNH